MSDYFLIIMEYIVTPFLAIFFSIKLKKQRKKNKPEINEFLEELDIEVRTICALCILNFAINNFENNSLQSMAVERLSWFGVLVAMLLVMYLLISPAKIQSSFNSKNAKIPHYFGLSNPNLPSSTFALFILAFYVVAGLGLRRVFRNEHSISGLFEQPVYKNIETIAFSLLILFLVIWLFLKILNQQVNSLIITKRLYETTFSNVISSESDPTVNLKEKVANYSMLISTLDNYPVKSSEMYKILIEAYNHLCQILKTTKTEENFDQAINLIDRVIELYKDPNVNTEIENVNDALVEKANIYVTFGKLIEAKNYYADLIRKDPANIRFPYELAKIR